MKQEFYKPRGPEVKNRLKRFRQLNAFVMSRGGWIVSLPGDTTVRIEVLSGSKLPAELTAAGYDSRERRRSVCPVSRRSFGRIVPSDASMESRLPIRRNPEKEIASFRAFRSQKLAISNLLSPEKSNPAQRLGRFFTAD